MIFAQSCSSIRQNSSQMTKEAIIDYFAGIVATQSNWFGHCSIYNYYYYDTAWYYKILDDGRYMETAYEELSLISFIPAQDEAFWVESLPPYLIEKYGVYFIPPWREVEWGPGNDDVERILRLKGHYVSSYKYDDAFFRIDDSIKGISIYFKKDNPKCYKIIKSRIAPVAQKAPKFKGVVEKVTVVNSLHDLPHYDY